jgi:cytochrome c553
MKHIGSTTAVLAMISLWAGPLWAQEALEGQLGFGGQEALGGTVKLGPQEDLAVRNCTFCHGPSGNGFMVAPRLAGQRPQYIENQLGAFIGHIRDNPYAKKYMWNAAANVSPERVHGLAAYFAAQSPRPANDGNKDLAAIGKEIFELGIPTENVVACIVCHAPGAEGIRQIPRLGGLSYLYVKRQLNQWNEGFRAKAAPMPQVAKFLSEDQIEALASYLSFIDNRSPE